MEQLKVKKQAITTDVKAPVRPADSSDLKPQSKNYGDFAIGSTAVTAKKQVKAKEKKVDVKEQQLNELVSNSLKTDDGEPKRWDNRPNTNTKSYGKKKESNFKFDKDEFPEL